ncbi:MAG: glycosyltransferase family 9 protein [Desulfobacterales bacterium]|nr:glycosyltransferase family 9 protein [Desulfobacterales bacterium]
MTKNHVLVIHHGALGDVVSTFPALLRLKKLYGSIAIICQNSIGQLAQELNVVDKWFPLEAAAFATLYSSHIDPVVKNILLSYCKIILFSRSRSLEKTLFSISENEVYRIPPHPDLGQKIHVTQHILSNLVRYSLLEESDKDTRIMLFSSIYSDRRNPQYDPSKIIIHPGSGSRKKCWPISNFVKVALSIDANGKQPEFILGPAEYDFYEILLQSKRLNANVHKIEKLTELAGLLKIGGGFIGNDSGVSHLAAFIGLPTVAVFGPSDPTTWKPMGRAVKVVRPDFECSPCFETGTVGCEEIECFNRITPEDVLAAFYGLVR